MPKWVNETRQNYLVELFNRSHGFCVFGHPKCTNPNHHYVNYSDDLVKDWIYYDRINTIWNNKAETEARHHLPDRLPLRGRFSGIAKDIYFDNQSQYEIETLGVDAVTFKPFAKVRLASSETRLYVDLSQALSGMSKNKRHKILRYANNDIIHDCIDTAVYQAVKDYYS